MGNCQVSEAATVAIQHPDGRLERLPWPTTASEVMKNHPGHHVALVTPHGGDGGAASTAAVSFTRARLLKPGDALTLGQPYRLITARDVMKAIEARKKEKMKRRQQQLRIGGDDAPAAAPVHPHEDDDDDDGGDQGGKQEEREEKQQQKTSSKQQLAAGRHRHNWRPSLRSIEEIAS